MSSFEVEQPLPPVSAINRQQSDEEDDFLDGFQAPRRRRSRLLLPIMVAVALVLIIALAKGITGKATDPQDAVRIEVISPGDGPRVTKDYRYSAMVTLYIEHPHAANYTKTLAGWSTRQQDGADHDEPFRFQPGVKLIEGWTEGVLQMNEGERAWLHVPASKGYGSKAMGSRGSSFFIPANSHLLFDIEILGKAQDTVG